MYRLPDSSVHVANQVDDHFTCKKRTKKNEICKASIWLTLRLAITGNCVV